jgi:hypothetical protein
MRVRVVSIGSKIPEFMNRPDCMLLTVDSKTGATLDVLLRNPTAQEQSDIQNGDISTGVFYENEIMVFLVKFGTGKWCDAPYNPWSVEQPPVYMSYSDGLGMLLTISLIDTTNGSVKALRAIGLPTNISNKIAYCVKAAHDVKLPQKIFFARLNSMYEFHTTQQMVDAANILGAVVSGVQATIELRGADSKQQAPPVDEYPNLPHELRPF